MKRIRSYLADIIPIIAGSALVACGINIFLAPNRISPGGISSVGTVLLHLFGVKLSVTNLAANILLFILGFRYLGKYAVVKTGFGIVFLTLFLEVTSLAPVFVGDMMLSAVIGGVLVGCGTGIVVRYGASTGGSDFAALIIRRFLPHVSAANIMLVIDCVIIVISGAVFRSVTVTAFSVISLYICSRAADMIIGFGDASKEIQIFSPKYDEIARQIMEEFDRGVTGVHCTGMYSMKESTVLMCIVSPKEVPFVMSCVRKIDRNAFIVIADVREVFGEGFRNADRYDGL